MGERHVVPDRNNEGWWKVIGSSSGATEQRSATEAEAIEVARDELERGGGGDILVHGADGKVHAKRTVVPPDD